MNSKLNLNFDLVNESREISKRIAEDTQKFIEKHSTVTVERTICRLLGIDGVNDMGVPLPNIVVENIQASNALGLGAAMYIGNAVLKYNLTPQEIAEKVSSEELDLPKIPMGDQVPLSCTGL